MNIIDRNFPLFFTGFLVGAFVFPVIAGGCARAVEDNGVKAEKLERAIASINEDMVVIKPRAGVECYILQRRRNDVPHAMSCVAVPF